MSRPRGFVIALFCVVLVVVLAAWTGARSRPQVRLDVGPTAEVFDAPIALKVSGLSSGQQATVQAQARDVYGELWSSWARFTADGAGTVDLAHTAPRDGTYRVADAAGLLWSLQPTYTDDPTAQFSMSTHSGFSVEIRVLVDGTVRAHTVLTRRAPPAPARTMTLQQAGFDGTLFLPGHTTANAPAVVVIGGSEGGERDLTTAALAAAGHPALALAYFKEPGLPSCLCSVPLEYFARAVAWLRAQPEIAARPVVLMGGSRGGEGALVIAAYLPSLVDAVIANSPSDLVNGAYGPGADPRAPAWTLGGVGLPAGTAIPVAKIRVPVLLSAGGQDAIWGSAQAAAQIVLQLDAVSGAPAHTDLYYPDAGHSVAGSPPYFPYNDTPLGGSPDADALAAEQYWPHMLAFVDSARRHPAS